jgi:hypothetical protein
MKKRSSAIGSTPECGLPECGLPEYGLPEYGLMRQQRGDVGALSSFSG